MLLHTLINASLSTILTVGLSILSLVIATVALVISYSRLREQEGKISTYGQHSKFNQVQIRHHENRLTQLEKKRKVKTIPMDAAHKNLKEAN